VRLPPRPPDPRPEPVPPLPAVARIGDHPAAMSETGATGDTETAHPAAPPEGATAILAAVPGAVGGRVLRYADALPVLAAHGLVPGPAGFAAADLIAAAAARGWAARTERVAARGTLRWRATVFGATRYRRHSGPMLTGATRRGATEAEALAVALAGLLRRHG
jgi:hypothetical protein